MPHVMKRPAMQVKKLAVQLTSTDDSLRYKGTLLLAKVLTHACDLSSDQEIRGACYRIFTCSMPRGLTLKLKSSWLYAQPRVAQSTLVQTCVTVMQVVEAAPGALADADELHHLALFFTNRMADW